MTLINITKINLCFLIVNFIINLNKLYMLKYFFYKLIIKFIKENKK